MLNWDSHRRIWGMKWVAFGVETGSRICALGSTHLKGTAHASELYRFEVRFPSKQTSHWQLNIRFDNLRHRLLPHFQYIRACNCVMSGNFKLQLLTRMRTLLAKGGSTKGVQVHTLDNDGIHKQMKDYQTCQHLHNNTLSTNVQRQLTLSAHRLATPTPQVCRQTLHEAQNRQPHKQVHRKHVMYLQ